MPAQSSRHTPAPVYGFKDRWLADALRLSIKDFTSDQLQAAEHKARQQGGDPESRILHWATALSSHLPLHETLLAWRQRASLMLLLMLVVAFAAGLSAALSVMGNSSQPVNVLWALGALLGVNLLMLLFWLISLGLTPGGFSAGRLWFWLSSRFQGREAVLLTRSLLGLGQRAGLIRWWLASITHATWTLALLGALCGLLLSLSLRSYAFVWETTILPASVFTAVVQSVGWLPSLFGFPVPDDSTVRAAGLVSDAVLQSDEQRRIWAGWLCGAVLIYGLLPRLVLLLISLWLSRSGLRSLRLDTGSADWARLSARLSPASERLGVTDPAPQTSARSSYARSGRQADGSAQPMIVGFELDGRIAWPPAVSGVQVLKVASREERSEVLSQLDQTPPHALLLVCDAAQTVDRGSLAWLTEASGRVLHVAVWLASDASATRRSVWRQQLQTLGLTEQQVFDDEAAALRWLEDFL